MSKQLDYYLDLYELETYEELMELMDLSEDSEEWAVLTGNADRSFFLSDEDYADYLNCETQTEED